MQTIRHRFHSTIRPASSSLCAVAATLVAFVLLAPTASARAGTVEWSAATRAHKPHLVVPSGKPLELALDASTPTAGSLVVIEPVGGLPRDAVLASKPTGTTTHATLRWTPAQVGQYTLAFRASSDGASSAPTITYVVEVEAAAHYPRGYSLTDRKRGHWAMVTRKVAVHSLPNPASRVVTTLGMQTEDGTQNLVLVLSGLDRSRNETWYRVRLPILPNNSTGWVPASALGKLMTVRTHLYIDLARLTATLERDGRPVFRAIIGAGRTYWPTPRGQFYVRSKLTNFDDPFYGPVAFGTSARTAVLTDWPAGGFIGVHGTSLPQLLPGRVSHGCIRMRNADITKLARLMRVGTPLTIR